MRGDVVIPLLTLYLIPGDCDARFTLLAMTHTHMSLDKILVSFIGVGAIVFIYWFFLMKKKRAVAVADSVDIKVEGGYSPDTIVISAGKLTTINFLRTDPSPCLEEVVLGDFKIKKFLPLNEPVTIELTPEKPGEYDFACGMNMYHGKILVK